MLVGQQGRAWEPLVVIRRSRRDAIRVTPNFNREAT